MLQTVRYERLVNKCTAEWTVLQLPTRAYKAIYVLLLHTLINPTIYTVKSHDRIILVKTLLVIYG